MYLPTFSASSLVLASTRLWPENPVCRQERILAWPLAYWGIQQWLNAFAYRMSWNFLLFLMPLLIVFVLATVTVSSNILKAALANLVDSIRHE